MSIKKIITGLMLSMLLSSGAANADWGDVYYCQMTNNNEISFEGETLKKHELEKFKFKLDQTRNAMVFGNTGHFKDEVFKLSEQDIEEPLFVEMGLWNANGVDSSTGFMFGTFSYASVGQFGIKSVSADCDKF